VASSPRKCRSPDSLHSFALTDHVLGRGGNCVVYKASWDGRPVAAKQSIALRDPALYGLDTSGAVRNLYKNHAELAVLLRELRTHQKLQHDRLIRLQAVIVDQVHGVWVPMYVLLELADCSVRNLISRTPNKRLPLAAAVKVLRQAAEGLAYMHGQTPPIVHRDIKPENLLICGTDVKLGDFGYIRVMSESACDSSLRGTALYTSWEYVVHPESISSAVDIFALGVTFFDMLGLDPQENPEMRAAGAERRQQLLVDRAGRLAETSELKALLQCLALEAQLRPTAGALVEFGEAMEVLLDKPRVSLLHVASRLGQLELASMLADSIAANFEDKRGQAPLHVASARGHVGVVRLLCEAGARMDRADHKGLTPLLAASRAGHLAVVEQLCKAGAQKNMSREDGTTPLALASKHGHAAVVRALCATCAQTDLATKRGDTPLLIASQQGHVEIVEALCEATPRATLDLADQDGWTPLLLAVQAQRLAIVQLLCDACAHINVASLSGATSLHLAAQNGHENIALMLLDAGAQTDPVSGTSTPLYIAAQHGRLQIVKMLCDAGAQKDTRGDAGWTPLYIASRNGHASVVKVLCGLGAKRDLPEGNGWTPLLIASRNGHLAVARVLCEMRANVDLPELQGATPLYIAAQGGDLSLVRMLCEAGAQVDAPTGTGATPLLIASQNGHKEVVRVLSEAGARKDMATADGWTPVSISWQLGHLDVSSLLASEGIP